MKLVTNILTVRFSGSLLNVNTSEVDYLLGFFNSDHLKYNLEANETQPDLTDMSLAAMNILSRNKNGYLLLIEGMWSLQMIFLNNSKTPTLSTTTSE